MAAERPCDYNADFVAGRIEYWTTSKSLSSNGACLVAEYAAEMDKKANLKLVLAEAAPNSDYSSYCKVS